MIPAATPAIPTTISHQRGIIEPPVTPAMTEKIPSAKAKAANSQIRETRVMPGQATATTPNRIAMMPRWWLIVVGIAGVAAGIIAAVYPEVTALLLVTFIGVWSIVRGVFEIAGAIAIRREIDNEWMLILLGALSVLFGLYVVIFPGAGALAIVWVIGIYAIVGGIMMVGFALRLRRHHQRA